MRRALLVFVLIATPLPVLAAAKAVTLVGVGGPGGERFAQQIAGDLSELMDVVPGSLYRTVANRLNQRGASPEEVQTVASELHVDAVIGGAIVGTGRERRLQIAVRNGRDGRVIARGRYNLAETTLPQLRERVVRDLVRALEHAGQPSPAEPAESPEPNDHAPSPNAEPESLSGLAVAERAPPVASVPGVFAGVGYSVLSRTLKFDAASAPRYDGGAVNAVRADGAVFPLALSAELAQAHPVLASFGFVGSYERVLGLSSTAGGKTSQGSASHWLVLLVGRIPLGHAASGGTLTVESGYQQLEWSHQSQLDVGVPNVDYRIFDAGLGWDRALGTRYLALALRVAYLAVLDAGDLTSLQQYGGGSGGGAEAEAGLTSWPLSWLWLRLGVRYDYLGLSFAANGTRLAHSSSDQWIGGTLEVGFAL